ncbi:TPA: DUF2612 domain-containing protein [Proteus mirabilis]|uniref:DUF2612 domain-containing protein n=1 Tax=Proteus mirabilis TaxID=584 RepID=UPI000E01D3DD|nr:DUF2612 domain-containing protein [Proteus mirabilis]EJG2210068.1 DUF2612 domain-containing protein [Proteus mirabilis]EKV1610241.1 DUF2612 domain-containing protein [Proteus mirabilis]ELA7738876.1 DUF2612 domain-containing protein [Proteus mirabilis]ELA7786271.1 DUF2612 domain-containing protein [Proteus mirabilis]MBI6342378.1 DUF2612 domain-containing protein [Proteus mirabilis]
MNVQQFEFHSDLLKAILWQYEDAENLKKLASFKASHFEKSMVSFWQNWYRDVFNIDTANDFGLSIWSRILDVPLGIDIPPSDKNKVGFGFGKKKANFKSNFRRNADYTLSLTVDQKRMLVRMRYFNLTRSPTVTNINAFLKRFFWRDDSKVFVLDPLDMTYMYYVFNFNPDERLRVLLENFDLMPRPSGVGVKYRIVTKKAFGVGQHRKNFLGSNFGA